MTLAEIISSYRATHGLSMDSFAEMCKLSKGYISMLEKNENPQSKKPIIPSLETLKKISSSMSIDLNDLLSLLDGDQPVSISWEQNKENNNSKAVEIPVLGRVVAGIPVEAVTDVIDYEEIAAELAATGDFFALQIKGNSMTPRICENDVVIVRKQPSVDSGSLAIVLINGEEATLKQVIVRPDGIMLQAFNPAVYPTHFYTCEDIKKLPVTILGKVVELRGKFI